MNTIVVGVDGSAGSEAALRWALAEANLRAARLRVVHAYQPPPLPSAVVGIGAAAVPPTVLSAEEAERVQSAAKQAAWQLIEGALRSVGGDEIERLEIEREPIEGPAAETLIESARGADLLVVGSRGRGGFLGLLLGSVSQQCAQHPPCPVVILPPVDDNDEPG